MSTPFQRLFALGLLPAAVLLLSACPGPTPPPSSEGDPCEPGGHLHRGPTEAESFCHCDRGYVAAEDALACEEVQTPAPAFPFEAGEEDACEIAAAGPVEAHVATEPPSAVAGSGTFQTLHLEGTPGTAGGAFLHVPTTSGRTLFFLGADVPFSIEEVDVGPVELEQGPVPTACGALGSVWGARLQAGARYHLGFGPTEAASVTLLLLQVD